MALKKSIHLKITTIIFCAFFAIAPFFQPKKVQANPALIGLGVGLAFAASGIGWGWFRDMNWTPEQVNQINEKCTENLKAAFPDPADYNEQMNILQNINGTLLKGGEVDWSKYSGKAIYAISKAVIDVLYPYDKNLGGTTSNSNNEEYLSRPLICSQGPYNFYLDWRGSAAQYYKKFPVFTGWRESSYNSSSFRNNSIVNAIGNYPGYANVGLGYLFMHNIIDDTWKSCALQGQGYNNMYILEPEMSDTGFRSAWLTAFGVKVGNTALIKNITAKTAAKVKLPTRLPQSVINNYNTYINGESENLVIDPTADELPQLPEDYNPVTDDPPDLDGFQDVTSDQEPTDTTDPTPTPTPTPSTPEYDGTDWVKRIGDFFDGLLTFVKGALVPTQAIDYTPLQNMGTDFSKKFPFSLPGDIVKLYGLLQAEPKRPEFHMTFDLSKVGVPGAPIVWDIKLEEWDEAAGIVKTALYIGFLIGLAFISKNFIRN